MPYEKVVLRERVPTWIACDWFKTIEMVDGSWETKGLQKLVDHGIKLWVLSFAGRAHASFVKGYPCGVSLLTRVIVPLLGSRATKPFDKGLSKKKTCFEPKWLAGKHVIFGPKNMQTT